MPLLEPQPTLRGRFRVFYRTQLPFALGALGLFIAVAVILPYTLNVPILLTGFGIAAVATVAALMVPWEKFNPHWMLIVPALDLVAVAFMRDILLPFVPSTGLLCVFPLLWIAYGFRSWAAVVAVAGTLFIVVFPFFASGALPRTPLEWLNIVMLPTIAIGITATVNVAAAQLRRAQAAVAARGREVNRTLRRSQDAEALSTAILETVNAGVAFYNADGELARSNPRAAEMTLRSGFRADVPPYAGPEAREADRVTLIPLDQQVIPRALRGELIKNHLEWLGPEGDQIAILVTSDQVRRPNGELLGTVVVGHDVTALAEAVNLREEFLATVSHELRTPLASILGFLELVEEEVDTEALGVDEYTAVIRRNAEELLRRVTELLSVSDGRITTLLTDIAPAEVVRQSVHKLGPMARSKDIRLTQTIAGDIRLQGDAHRLEQAIDNLISNAVKYSPAGSIVRVGFAFDHDEARITVSDDGRGMNREEVRQSTEKFYRAQGVRDDAVQGVGIGLSIVKAIVEGHGGRIEIESTPGRGTTVALVLPR